jgi:hypothetical protein
MTVAGRVIVGSALAAAICCFVRVWSLSRQASCRSNPKTCSRRQQQRAKFHKVQSIAECGGWQTAPTNLHIFPQPRQDMSEAEYLPLIRESELAQLQRLVKRVMQARGWAAPGPACIQAWDAALAAAQSESGGGWGLDFTPADLTSPRLQALGDVLDTHLLGGCLQGWLRSQGKAPVGFAAVNTALGPDDWISHYSKVCR